MDSAGEGWPQDVPMAPSLPMREFVELVMTRGLERYRELPWRNISDPYAVWISEVMLQQTQVARVDGRWQRWMERFPVVDALAEADPGDVLEEWQGMGYNRRALSLLRAARQIVAAGEFPKEEQELVVLPGIGPATAAGIRAFAYNLPGVYLETNVRTVFLHELFPCETDVPDRALVPLVRASCPKDLPRNWYYALLDYGAWLKRTVPNPSRRSRAHVRQSRFEGSHRQKRGEAVRMLLAARGSGVTAEDVSHALSVSESDARTLLDELAEEGFCAQRDSRWYV